MGGTMLLLLQLGFGMSIIMLTAAAAKNKIVPLPTTKEDTGWPVKFKNYAARPMNMYWVSFDGKPTLSGTTVAADGGTQSFQTYRTHKFFWGEVGVNPPVVTKAKGAVGSQFTITDTVRNYYFYDASTTAEVYAELLEEEQHMVEYRAKTGRHWIATSWPRPPPKYDTWKPTKIGQKFFVSMKDHPKAWKFECSKKDVSDCYADKKIRKQVNPAFVKQIEPTNFTIEVVSVEPKVFMISDFVTDFEAEYMISEASPKLHQSTTGNGADAKVQTNLRNSKSAWLHHGHSNVIDAIYKRLGVVTLLGPDEMDHNHVEAMNVLNYPTGGQYQDHFDWTADGFVESRFISGLLYLNTPEKGGKTNFPRARMPGGKFGTSVRATKRSLVFFYNVLDDGNADELSYHAGLPVEKGSKWISPVWIWEPSRSEGTAMKKIRSAQTQNKKTKK